MVKEKILGYSMAYISNGYLNEEVVMLNTPLKKRKKDVKLIISNGITMAAGGKLVKIVEVL